MWVNPKLKAGIQWPQIFIYLFIYYHTIAVLGVNDDIYKPSDLFLNISYRKFADMQNTYKDTSFSHSPHHVTISVY
jgi:hypothetical protein